MEEILEEEKKAKETCRSLIKDYLPFKKMDLMSSLPEDLTSETLLSIVRILDAVYERGYEEGREDGFSEAAEY